MAPPRKPTALKVLHGDRKDRINSAEPAPSARTVVPPGWLSPAALEVWASLVADLEAKGVLTCWDVEAYGAYCDAVVRHREAARMLDEQGPVVEAAVFDRNGVKTGFRLQKNDWWFIWKESADIVMRVGARFGLTPSDRAGLSVGKEPEHGKGASRLLS